MKHYVRRSVSISFEGALDRTQQEFKDSCDINKLISRLMRDGGELPEGDYGEADISEVGDLQDQLERQMKGKEWFDSLPDEHKERFGHNVQLLFDFYAKHPEALEKDFKKGVSATIETDVSQPNMNASEGERSDPERAEQAPKATEKRGVVTP